MKSSGFALSPSCCAFTGSVDMAATVRKSAASRPGALRSAWWTSARGVEGETSARMSKPPPKLSTSLKALTIEPVMVEPTTSVKTTSVNMASVTPVRKRLRSGYATAIRSTGASGRIRPRVALSPPSRRSAL